MLGGGSRAGGQHAIPLPGISQYWKYWLAQSQQLEHQSNMWNLFTFNNKDTRTITMALLVVLGWRYWLSLLLILNRFHILFWCFPCWLWTSIHDALRDLVPFLQFKKHEKHHEGVLLSVKLQALACNFTKSSTSPWGDLHQVFLIVQMVSNRAKYLKCSVSSFLKSLSTILFTFWNLAKFWDRLDSPQVKQNMIFSLESPT